MSTADLLVHVHPELPQQARAKVEKDVSDCDGVVSAHFDHHKHPHALIVLYNPDRIKSNKILETVKQHDQAATMAGL